MLPRLPVLSALHLVCAVVPVLAASPMTDLDALTALLAHYGTVDGVEHQEDGHGGCVLCFVHVPYTDDEHLVVRYPCAFAALPSLIEAARREAAIRHWWETTHATELDRHDHHCPAERFRGPPPGHFENTGEPCACGWTEASAALHDNAGTPVATPGAGE